MGILEGKRREEEGRGGYGGKVAKNTPLPPAMNDGLVVEVISSLVISAPSSSGNFTGTKMGLTLDGEPLIIVLIEIRMCSYLQLR